MNRGNILPKPKKVLMSQIHNRFDIEVIDASTGEVKQRAKAENVILDNLWSVFSGSSWFNFIAYGKGSGTPSPSDKGLFSLAGISSLTNISQDNTHVADGYISRTGYASLSETTAVGVTITELGLCTSSNTSNTVICTHAMLTDMNGNPISILKTNTDIINLYATVFFHWDLDGYNGVEFIPTDMFPPFSMTGSATLSFSKGKSRGGQTGGDMAYFGYNSSNRTYTCTSPRVTVSQLNIGGFQYVTIGGFFVIKIQGPHRIIGESVGTGNGSAVNFATKYDLASNAVVYVDGVIDPSATVVEEPIHPNDMGQYFWCIHPASTEDQLIPGDGTSPTHQFAGSAVWPSFGIGVFYNPFHELGVDSHSYSDLKRLEASNDLIRWEIVYDYTDKINKPITDFRNHKFWRTTSRQSQYSSHYWGYLKCNSLTGKNIHFATPPAKGAVITIDYDTPMVPKDENHVFDFQMSVQFGAYGES